MCNATRHARASRLRFVLRSGDDGDGRLKFTDDGAGFDSVRVVPGRGLRNLAERAAELGGELTIGSAPGCGTRIRLTLPAAVATAAELGRRRTLASATPRGHTLRGLAAPLAPAAARGISRATPANPLGP